MRSIMRRAVVAAAVVASLAAGSAAPAAPPMSIAAAVADPARSAQQVATDANRKPAESLAFAGVKGGMIVGEFFPGGGYYTQLLSDIVGHDGRVYGVENGGWTGAAKLDQDFVDEKKLRNVSIAGLPFGEMAFPRPLDLVWISQNYHDLKVAEFGHVDTVAFNRAVYAALKPGGTYVILDHQAPPGTDLAAISRLHRIEKAQVIREVTAAGFVLRAEGDFLHRPGDDHSLPVSDAKIQGHTDQFALRFEKPR